MRENDEFHKMLFAIGNARANSLSIKDLDELCSARPEIRCADDFNAAVNALIDLRRLNRGSS